MKYLIFVFIIIQQTSCHEPMSESSETAIKNDNEKYGRIKFTIDVKQPTVGIDSYSLITNNPGRDSVSARELIREKVILPLAMQRHDRKLFDSTLSENFTYEEEAIFLNREEYINDRVNAKWMISDVRYENLVLQFIDNYGILTYHNKVKEKDEFGKDQLFSWFWTDVWVKENGRWKLKSLIALN